MTNPNFQEPFFKTMKLGKNARSKQDTCKNERRK